MGELALENILEALLFVADGPVAPHDLARAASSDDEAVAAALERLGAACAGRGVRLLRTVGRVQMVAAPEAGPAVEALLGISEAGKLSQAAMEALSLIAYRQPITRAQIEAVRGVNSDGVLRSLQARQLIEPVGRLDQAGRPVIYATTAQFLHYFGITSLQELPTLPALEPPASASIAD